MLYSIRGTYKNGIVELYEKVPYDDKMEVLITFLPKEDIPYRGLDREFSV